MLTIAVGRASVPRTRHATATARHRRGDDDVHRCVAAPGPRRDGMGFFRCCVACLCVSHPWGVAAGTLSTMNHPYTDDLALALGELAASATHHDHAEADEPRCCPVCGEAMAFFQQFDIVMDVCEAHGVWLDQGELATLLERTYWHRREHDEASDRNPGRNMDETRRTFTAGMHRVMGCVAKFDKGRS
jgi:Zn-finger nucleic acid-binding protein